VAITAWRKEWDEWDQGDECGGGFKKDWPMLTVLAGPGYRFGALGVAGFGRPNDTA
jgi:hypothetical protein